jgi:photosystem II stability/assembly factor-like uncharacterized protein
MPHHTLSLFAITLLWLTFSVGYGQTLKWKEIGASPFFDIAITSRVILMTNNSNDVFRSEDTGRTWQYSGTVTTRCNQINIVAHGNSFYMGFGYWIFRGRDTSDLDEGVYRSDDDGRSWRRILRGNVSRVIASETMLIAVVDDKFLFSTDRGISWQNSNYYTSGQYRCIDNTLFVCTFAGLIRITLDPTKPPQIDTLLKEYNVRSIEYIKPTISVRADKKNLPPLRGLAYSNISSSSDMGNSWKHSLLRVFGSASFLDTLLGGNLFSFNGRLGMLYASYIYMISENEGASWKFYIPVNWALTGQLLDAYLDVLYAQNGIVLAYLPKETNIFRVDTRRCDTSEIFFSDTNRLFVNPTPSSCEFDGYAQQSFSQKPHEIMLGLTSKGDTLYANTKNGIFCSGNNGLHWERIGFLNEGLLTGTATPSELYSRNTVFHKSHFFALSWGGFYSRQVPEIEKYDSPIGCRLLRLPKGGSFWKTITAYPFNTFDSIYAIGSFGNNLVVAKEDTVYYSTNNGDRWQKASAIPRVTVFADNGLRLFAGTEQHGIYISSDSGATWRASQNNIQGTVKAITSRDRIVFATTDNGIWRSFDNGNSWFSVNEGLSDRNIQSVTTTKQFVFALDSAKNVFLSTNDGDSWQKTPQSVDAVAIQQHENYLFAYSKELISRNGLITDKSHFFRSEIPLLNVLPNANLISQVAPNPTSTSTLFTFDVEVASRVSLRVYDMLGRTTAILADDGFSVGRHYINWDVNNISSGTYFYRLLIGSRVSSGRIVVIR